MMIQKKKLAVKKIPIAIVLFVIVSMAMFQVFYNSQSQEQVEHKKTYRPIIKERDNLQAKAISDFENELITKSVFLTAIKEIKNNSNLKLKAYNKKKRKLALEHSFLGRSSFKFWISQFGLILALFYFASKSLYQDLKNLNNSGHQYISFIGIVICLFFFYHLLFLTQRDFLNDKYYFIILFSAISVGIFYYIYIKYLSQQKGIISYLITLISDIKVNHYFKMAKNVDNNKLSRDLVLKDTKEVDQKIFKTLKKI